MLSTPTRRAVATGSTVLLTLAAVLVGVMVRPAGAEAMLEVYGHGWGHGRGMGQYGALGYAIDHGANHRQIVDYFYQGTTAGHVGNGVVGVRLMAQDGVGLTVQVDNGPMTSSPGGQAPNKVLRVVVNPDNHNTFRIYDAPGCTGPFTLRGVVGEDTVTITPPGSADRSQMLQLCEYHGNGGFAGTRWYRGLMSIRRTQWGTRTVNHVHMEDYLRGVVPRESPASWGDAGGGKGAHALRAQAVAARSYSAAENRYPYAQTCDTISCQVYGGHAHQPAGGGVNVLEDSRTDAAIAATAGEVRMRNGAPARTEFSSSTGGWSAGGVFPAVEDAGDDVASNPNHAWTVHLPFSKIESNYNKGHLRSATVEQRNGLGAEGGRVLRMRLSFSGGDVVLSGDEFRRDFNLKSNWFSFRNLGPADSRTDPPGGWVLHGNGTIRRFGAAPDLGSAALDGSPARALAVGGRSAAGGYVLTGYGSLVPVGDASSLGTGGAVRFGAHDVARDLVLRRDGRSGWILDAFGGVHAFGGAPATTIQDDAYHEGAYTSFWLLQTSQGDGGYIVKSDGSVWRWGSAAQVRATVLPGGRWAVGAVLHASGSKGWVIDNAGAAHPFQPDGASPPTGLPGTPTAVEVAERPDGRSGYVVKPDGSVAPYGGAPPVSLGGAGDVAGLELVPRFAGYVLDGFGGLHAFDGAPPVTSATYFAGDPRARQVLAFPHGGGWVLDEFGEVFPFGTEAGAPPPRPWGGRRFSQPLVRDVVLIPGTNQGYVLDGWGGMHAFNGAPAVRNGPYWSGWDIATGATVNPDGKGGYVLDAWGGIHPFSIGGHSAPPKPSDGAYWPGWAIVRDITSTGQPSGFTLDGWGGTHPYNGASGRGSWYWGGQDLAVALTGDGSARGWGAYLDAWGGLHTTGSGSPRLHPTAHWPGWRIARDLALLPR